MSLRTAPISVADLMDRHLLYPVFQPIVDMRTSAIVGYEALTRGPRGTEYAAPAAIFARAREEGLLGELDRYCQAMAVGAAVRNGLWDSGWLFLNAAVDSGAPPPAHYSTPPHGVVIELTEDTLYRIPRRTIDLVRRARAMGIGIALDDVGVHRSSLAMIPILEPDVVKLDKRIIHTLSGANARAAVSALGNRADGTRPISIAEGIETDQDRQAALAIGARYGQGWLFGAGTTSPRPAVNAPPLRVRPATPFLPIHSGRVDAELTYDEWFSMFRSLAHIAIAAGSTAVVVLGRGANLGFTAPELTLIEKISESVGAPTYFGCDAVELNFPGLIANVQTPSFVGPNDRGIAVVTPKFSGWIGLRRSEFQWIGDRREPVYVQHHRPIVASLMREMLSRAPHL